MSTLFEHPAGATLASSNPDATGVAVRLPRSQPLSHFHAHRIGDADIVMACTQFTSPVNFAPTMQQVRVFTADAADRARMPLLDADRFMASTGALAYVSLDLKSDLDHYPFDIPSDRVARLTEFRIAGEDAHDRGATAGTGLADWIMRTIESELVHSTYFALKGDSRSFWPGLRTDALDWDELYAGNDYGVWAADWLEHHGYAVFRDDPGQFFLVFNPPLLELIEAGEVS